MRRSGLAITAALAGVAAIVVVAVMASPPRGPAASHDGAVRTPWGQPDLQGIWYNDAQTPLERPAEFAGREFLTPEEIAALDQKRAALPSRDRRAQAGTDRDVAGAYNSVWDTVRRTGKRTSLIVDPPDGKIPPLTDGAKTRAAMELAYRAAPNRSPNPGTYNTERMNRADGPEDRSLVERCLGSALPDYNDFIRIVQSPQAAAIYYEHGQGGGGNRVIPIDGRPHLPSHMREWLGDARARWEGNTLVVDTTNFTPKTPYRGATENLHLVERFTRVDATTLNYVVTIEDPATWTKPWTVAVSMKKQSDKEDRIFEAPCHEGNYGLTGMLASTRAAERDFAAGRGPNPDTIDLATGGGAADPFGAANER